MSRWYFVVALLVGALMSASPTAANAQVVPIGDGEGEGPSCFTCFNAPIAGCYYADRHDDMSIFGGPRAGEFHSCMPGTCADWYGSYGHIPYQSTEPEAFLAMGARSVDDVLVALQELPGLQFNARRRALQVVTHDGAVVRHVPLSDSVSEELSVALASLHNTEREVASIANR